jgi:hypothetical protein
VDSLVAIDGKYEVVLTDDFDGMMKRLSGAHQLSKFTACATQLYASWIVHNALWATKTDDYYVDYKTGEIHDSYDSAPDDAKPRLSLRHKQAFKTKAQFFTYLSSEIPDFNVSTFWSRHRTVLKRIEVWRKAHGNPEDMPEDVFINIVQDVVLYGKHIDDVIINGMFEITSARKGVPAEIVSLSDRVDKSRLGINEEFDSEAELLREVASTVLDKLEDAHDQVRAGVPVRNVASDLRNELLNESSIRFIAYGSDIMLKYTPGSNGDIIPTIQYALKFIDRNGEIIDVADMDEEVIEWLERHLHITIHG